MKIQNVFLKKIVIVSIFVLCGNFIFAAPDLLNQNSGNKDGFIISENAYIAMNTPNYPVTAGDIYQLAYNSQTSILIPVDLTYKIRIANLGQIDCNGMTYLDLKDAVISLVQRNYPMSSVQFVLEKPAVFTITVSGEVHNTVEIQAWSLTRLSTLVSQNATDYASYRNVSVISANGKKRNYDLFMSSRSNDLSQDPYMRPGDKVIVNRMERKVTVNGAVERPGEYELLKGENLKELIEKYGYGKTDSADLSKIELRRYIDNDDFLMGEGKTEYLSENDVKENKVLLNGDVIHIPSKEDVKKTIFLEGAVEFVKVGESSQATQIIQIGEEDNKLESKRVIINYSEGENYTAVLRKYADCFSTVSDLENAIIVRKVLNSEGKLEEQYIPLNIAKILYDDSYYTSENLQNLDVVSVPFNKMYVNVTGAVLNPGRYPYIAGRTWDYYIRLAGGFDNDKNSNEKVEIKSSTGKKMSKKDIILPETTIRAENNDVLYVWSNKIASPLNTLFTLITAAFTVFALFVR